jgi:hypothetical protein
VDIGAGGTYGALANNSVSNTGNTVIDGDVGADEANDITGFPPGTYTGSEYSGDVFAAAYDDVGNAFDEIFSFTGGITLTGNLEDQGPLSPGLYYFEVGVLDGTLELVGNSDPNEAWYFQIEQNLTTFDGSAVAIYGAEPCQVFWVVGYQATIKEGSIFAGTLIADYFVTMNGSTTSGGLFAGEAIFINSATILAEYCPPTSSTSSSSTMATSSSSSFSSSVATSSSSSSASPTSSSYSNSSSSSTIASSSSSCPSPTPSTVPLVELGSAGEYGVLGAGDVTNTGLTNVSGNIGARESISGHPVAQGIESTGSVVLDALEDAGNAYREIEALIGAIEISADLGGLNLGPGIYGIDGAAMLNGTLTLDSTSTLDLVGNNFWYFQLDSTLTTDVDSVVAFIGDAQPCNVFWMVPSTATFGSDSTFVGNVLAENIQADSGADFYGGLYAYDISLDANTVFVNCPPQTTASSSSVATATSTSPSAPTNTSPGSPTTETGSPAPTETSPGSSPGEPGSPTSTTAGGSTNPPVFTGSGNASKGWTISGTLILVFLLNTFGY